MIKFKEIAFTGYPVTDVPRARKFYEGTLGLKPALAHEIRPGMWWVEYDINGGTLAVTNAWAPSGQSGPSIALEVEDVQAAITYLKQSGVKFTMEYMETPVCHLCSVADPDGNEITLHQRKA
jgi:predicted enzyme related to lactoylglutathione lyase